jgi:hypothetical protein
VRVRVLVLQGYTPPPELCIYPAKTSDRKAISQVLKKGAHSESFYLTFNPPQLPLLSMAATATTDVTMDAFSVTSDGESPESRNGGGMQPRRDSTVSQTAKKREMDRLAQKKSREKARNRVMELEKKLETLQSDDKQKQITSLLKTVDDLKKENERLKGVATRIQGLVEGIGNTPGSTHVAFPSNC